MKADPVLDFLPETSPFFLYLSVFLGPFIQEDAAVFLAGTLSATGRGDSVAIFIVICAGLFFSDIWKYWIGWAALKIPKARDFAEKKHVADFQDKVERHLIPTMLAARFVPLTRVPTYVACGFFRINYLKFCVLIAITAVLYSSVVFYILHMLDKLLGDKLPWVMPIIGVTVLITYLLFNFIRARQIEKDPHAHLDDIIPVDDDKESQSE